MKVLIIVLLTTLTLLPLRAQRYVEVKTNILNLAGGAVAWGDYNCDGSLDLFISGIDSLSGWHSIIYRNDNGTFTDIQANILGVANGARADWGDYDNDGDLDLLIAGADNTIHGRSKVYRNDNGVFIDINANTAELWYVTMAKWGDFNGDNKPDILLSGYCDFWRMYITEIYKNDDNDSFVLTGPDLPSTIDQSSLGFVDYNGDGMLDIYLPGNTGKFASFYKNSNGRFNKISTDIELLGYSGYSDMTDFDNDGNLDIAVLGKPIEDGFVTSDLPTTRIYRYLDGNYIDIEANLEGLSQGVIKWVDFNLDGNADLFMSGMDRFDRLNSYLYRNDSGEFIPEPCQIPGFNWSDAAIGDYNNDNAPDIIVIGSDSAGHIRTKLYKNLTTYKLLVSPKFICGISDSVTVSYVGDISVFDSLKWDFDGGTILNSSNNSSFKISWSSPGEKNIKLVLYKYLESDDTLSGVLNVYPDFSVSLGEDTTVNKGSYITLCPQVLGGTLPLKFIWDEIPGDSIRTYRITKDSSVFLKAKDTYGCWSSDIINIPVNDFVESICLVTVDINTGKNTLFWEKSDGIYIKEYEIQKINLEGSYYAIGKVPFSSDGIYTDENTDPSQRYNRYKLATIDSNDYYSFDSDFHQTIHLEINQELPGIYNLLWTPYIGFEYYTYFIYKGSSLQNIKLIDSIANSYTQYTDTSAGIAYYQIAIKKSSACFIDPPNLAYESISQSVSNIVDNMRYVGISDAIFDKKFQIYPVPYENELTLEGTLNKPSLLKITIFNILGEKTYESLSYQQEGYFKMLITGQKITNTSEIGILRVEVENTIYSKKIIRK